MAPLTAAGGLLRCGVEAQAVKLGKLLFVLGCFLFCQLHILLVSLPSESQNKIDFSNAEKPSVLRSTAASFDAYTPDIPFAELEICSRVHGKYHCLNNPTCDPSLTCHRHQDEAKPYSFKRTFDKLVQTRTDRQATLRGLLERMESTMGANPKKEIMMMIVNSGFAHVFGNWVCGLSKRLSVGEIDQIKARLIILPGDDEAAVYAGEKLGFFVATSSEMESLSRFTGRYIMPYPAVSFGRGSHGTMMMILKLALPLDLLLMGFSVFVQDVDFVWNKNAFQHVLSTCDASECDAAFIQEGRNYMDSDFVSVDIQRPSELDAFWQFNAVPRADRREPLPGYIPEVNTGMFLLRPTPAILSFMRTLVQGSHLQLWKSRDQPLFNSVLWHRRFQALLRVKILRHNDFIPGTLLHERKMSISDDNTLRLDEDYAVDVRKAIAMHFCDTANVEKKVARMQNKGVWFFTPETCPLAVYACDDLEGCSTYKDPERRKQWQQQFQDDADPSWASFARKLRKSRADNDPRSIRK